MAASETTDLVRFGLISEMACSKELSCQRGDSKAGQYMINQCQDYNGNLRQQRHHCKAGRACLWVWEALWQQRPWLLRHQAPF